MGQMQEMWTFRSAHFVGGEGWLDQMAPLFSFFEITGVVYGMR